MRIPGEKVKALLRMGAKLILRADDYRYSELEDFVRLSANIENEMILVIGDNLQVDEVSKLHCIGREFLRIDLSRN